MLREIKIRKALPSEANTLTKIAIAAKRYWGYPEEYIELWRDELTFTAEDVKDSIIYVATLNETIVGFYAIKATLLETTYELDDLWINPEHIGQGLGKVLFCHAAEVVQAEGAHKMRLVAEPNALGFYKKMGMAKIDEVDSKPEGRVLDLMSVELPLTIEPRV